MASAKKPAKKMKDLKGNKSVSSKNASAVRGGMRANSPKDSKI